MKKFYLLSLFAFAIVACEKEPEPYVMKEADLSVRFICSINTAHVNRFNLNDNNDTIPTGATYDTTITVHANEAVYIYNAVSFLNQPNTNVDMACYVNGAFFAGRTYLYSNDHPNGWRNAGFGDVYRLP